MEDDMALKLRYLVGGKVLSREECDAHVKEAPAEADAVPTPKHSAKAD